MSQFTEGQQQRISDCGWLCVHALQHAADCRGAGDRERTETWLRMAEHWSAEAFRMVQS